MKSGTGAVLREIIPQSTQSAKPFLQSLELGLPPPPQASVPPTLRFRGEGHTRLRERGESPNSNEGTDTVVHLVYMQFPATTSCLQCLATGVGDAGDKISAGISAIVGQ
jgi:hypothetical protein